MPLVHKSSALALSLTCVLCGSGSYSCCVSNDFRVSPEFHADQGTEFGNVVLDAWAARHGVI